MLVDRNLGKLSGSKDTGGGVYACKLSGKTTFFFFSFAYGMRPICTCTEAQDEHEREDERHFVVLGRFRVTG